MPTVTLKDPRHVNFMLNNLRKFVAKVKEQSENTTMINGLLIAMLFLPKTGNSKFYIFLCITSGFI
jgi:hypothetical protein